MNKEIVFEKIIAPESAVAFFVKKGQILRITDIEGKQVGDLVIFNEHDYSEKLSQGYTRRHAGKLDSPYVWELLRGITTGHHLMSTIENQMMTIVADTPVPGGIHDLLFRMCTQRVQTDAGLKARPGCLELLTKVFESYKISPGNIPDPLNVFMNTHFDPANGMLIIDEPVSRPGDYIELRAEMDLLCGLTACPEHLVTMCSGHPPHPPKPLKVEVFKI